MAIRKHLDWDGNKEHGFVDFGFGFNNNSVTELATECLIFFVAGINQSWKSPIAYFLSNHVSSIQKTELLQRCLDV